MLENKNNIALSFDVEFWHESAWLAPYSTKEMIAKDTFPSSIEKILQTLRENNGRATFFVTRKVTDIHPEIIRRIVHEGHELGIHGPQHKKLKYYNKEEFYTDCKEHMELLKKLTGKQVTGYRAPHFSLTKKTNWLLPTLKKLGFLYDSSAFPKNMGEYGNSKISIQPFRTEEDILEIPVSVGEVSGIRVPFAGGVYFRLLPYKLVTMFLKKMLRKKTTPVLYFHPHELDTETPRITKGPFLKRYLKYFGVRKSFGKFEKLVKEYKTDSIENIFLVNGNLGK